MRLDKFLKVSRIIKRRTVAKDASLDSLIMVNDKICKPSYDVKVGDIIKINYYHQTLVVKVLEIINTTKKSDASSMYEILEVIENKNETF